jgi:hypothetical protein
MTPSQQAILKKAVRSWRAAQTLYEEGFSDFAASRAYYTSSSQDLPRSRFASTASFPYWQYHQRET